MSQRMSLVLGFLGGLSGGTGIFVSALLWSASDFGWGRLLTLALISASLYLGGCWALRRRGLLP